MNYIFFIGGSGARVYKSFLHACAAGVVHAEAARVMLLDADAKNAACAESCDLFRLYQQHHQAFNSRSFSPFQCDIQMYRDGVVSPMNTDNPRLYYVTGGNGPRNRILNWFYTEEEQNQNLEKGFYAHPNIGCLFFQNFGGNRYLAACLRDIVSDLQNNRPTRVVIVGSVFGGTGAAGIPSILKILQDTCAKNSLSFDDLQTCAVLITPYFRVAASDKGSGLELNRDDGLKIDSDTFYGNTKTALHYYHFTNEFKKYYLVGQTKLDLVNSSYADGGKDQDNKAHIVELCAAMAVKDFLEGNTGGMEVSEWIVDHPDGERTTWASFGKDIYALADMLRTQAILETAIYPYSSTYPSTTGRYQWYKIYGMEGGNQEALLGMQTYSAAFFKWMYHLQYECAVTQEPARSCDVIALCEPDVLRRLWQRSQGRMAGSIEKPEYKKRSWRKYQEDFNNLVETLEGIDYVAEPIFRILSRLGVVLSENFSALGFVGLFMRLFDLATKRKADKH